MRGFVWELSLRDIGRVDKGGLLQGAVLNHGRDRPQIVDNVSISYEGSSGRMLIVDALVPAISNRLHPHCFVSDFFPISIAILGANNVKRAFNSTVTPDARGTSEAPVVREKDAIWERHGAAVTVVVVVAVGTWCEG